VVDDDPEVRHVTASFLNDFGYSETEAPVGRSALALMEQGHSFDLRRGGSRHAGMTGVELATAIRQRFSGVPVLLLTRSRGSRADPGRSAGDDEALRLGRARRPGVAASGSDGLIRPTPLTG
jgi:CheY-like chemotaxis protein